MRTWYRLGPLCATALALVALAACGGSSGSGDPTKAITTRMNSLVGHINNGDGKGILDDDVPASARRTCSDKDARDTVDGVRKEVPAGSRLVVQSVSNVSVNGNKATAAVVFGPSGAPTPAPLTVAFIKDGGSWKLDTTGTSGCNALIPTGVG